MFTAFIITMADWHHHQFSGSHGSEASGDDKLFTIFFFSALLIVFGTLVVSFLGGPIILFFTRKARNLFWAIPGANLLLYFLMLVLRPYPEGFAAQFRLPGLVFTIIEILLLLLLSLILAAVLALIYTVLRKLRSLPTCKQGAVNREPDMGGS